MVEIVPEIVVMRLPLYVRVLAMLKAEDQELVSSQTLGTLLQATPAQIRKDLSYFGRFGKQGRGYRVAHLLQELRQIMGLDREWTMVLIGVGLLGRAILRYGGFMPQGFHIVRAFESDPGKIGTKIGGVMVQDRQSLEAFTVTKQVDIGIVAVPAEACQEVVDLLVRCGIRAILNYAPYQAQVPQGVWMRDIDPVVALQSMTYYLKSPEAFTESAAP